ncbi:hypothetical protein [Vibrio chagasii]|uniref:hypothetical protein n=1 Tax=Vibrio chagasii TaxID=170679 RepID=UPI0021C40986|nr:hypothetical protein [Vibrio chagasii]
MKYRNTKRIVELKKAQNQRVIYHSQKDLKALISRTEKLEEAKESLLFKLESWNDSKLNINHDVMDKIVSNIVDNFNENLIELSEVEQRIQELNIKISKFNSYQEALKNFSNKLEVSQNKDLESNRVNRSLDDNLSRHIYEKCNRNTRDKSMLPTRKKHC